YIIAAKEAREICGKFGSDLIINDNVKVMIASNAYGVHLGKNDQSPAKARTEVGSKIIGGTANTLKDCLKLIEQGVDYIGLGPFRFTETKKELDPILGFEGYRTIMSALSTAEHSIPIFAIGGINTIDIPAILDTGVYGVSVSGLLTNVEDLKERIKEIQTAI
ncbi:MAG: thiamine phosphate synthase, partial [Crocinitomicaceae bacterium]|nr:thiamine phosphate synthase [Crocinitomicaceae bacterium]